MEDGGWKDRSILNPLSSILDLAFFFVIFVPLC